MLSDERLAEIRAREQAATRGPWTNPWEEEPSTGKCQGIWGPYVEPVIGVEWHDGPRLAVLEADAAFIAASRQDVPDLLAEVERLRARVVVLECIAHEAGMLLEALRPVQRLVSLRMADVKSLLNRLREIDYGAE